MIRDAVLGRRDATATGSSSEVAGSADNSGSLRNGSVGDEVTRAQELLITVGSPALARNGATGRYLAITEAAVREFQERIRAEQDSAMVVDGVVGPATWRWLKTYASRASDGPNPAPASSGDTIEYGDTGPAVTALQNTLLRLGAPLLERHGATGRYFAATRDSVIYFQQTVRAEHDPTMVVDGVVGPATRRWLDRLDRG